MGQKHQLANLRLAAVKNAVLAVVDAQGIVKLEVGFQPGLHEVEHLAPVMTDEDVLEVLSGCQLVAVAGSRNRAMAYPEGNVHSGADPNWKPVEPAEKKVRKIERMVDGLKRERIQLRREMDQIREDRQRKKDERKAEKAAQQEAENAAQLEAENASEQEAQQADEAPEE